MKVAKITLHNFGSFFGTHQVQMSGRGLTFVRGENLDEPKMESNGAGKSTLFDALAWCLFGHVPKGDLAKSVVCDDPEAKDTWVITELHDEPPNAPPEVFWIYRHRKSSSVTVRFFAAEESGIVGELTAMDADVTQQSINQALGLDKDVFYAAVYRAQGATDEFAEATDAKRKELLTKLIPELEEVSGLQEKAKALLKEEQLKGADLIQKRGAAEQEITLLQSRNWDAERLSWEQDRAQRKAQAQGWYEKAVLAVQEGQAKVQKIQSLDMQLASLVQPQASTAWSSEVASRKAIELQAVQVLATAKAAHNQAQERYKHIHGLKVGAKCSNCGALISPEHQKKELEEITTQGKAKAAELQQAQQQKDLASAAVKEAEQYAAQEASANQVAWQTFTSQKAAIDAEKAQCFGVNLDQLNQQHQQAYAQVMSIDQEQWPGTAAQQVSQARVAELYELVAGINKASAQVEHAIAHLEFWHQALGNTGLKSYILDSRLEEMTEAANSWVQALTGGTTWIRFETQTLTSGGKLSEKFNIRVFRHNPDGSITERNFKSWSGGEKKRVSLGIDQGLSRLVADRATKHWDIYIIDESFRQHLDQGGREAVFDLLEQLEQDRESIFVVDHDPQMGAQFQNQLKVRIQNRRSTFPEEPEFLAGGTSPIPAHFLPEGAL